MSEQDKASLLQDGNYSSRKFILTLLGLAILIIMTILAAYMPALVALYPTFVGGLLGTLGIYFGVNVAHRYAVGKNITDMESIIRSEQEPAHSYPGVGESPTDGEGEA